MKNLARILNLLSIVSLSLFSGAFLFIAFVIVKFWQAVEPEIFLTWMQDNFFRFPILMIPLNLISLLATLLAFGLAWKFRPTSRLALGLSLICIFASTVTYPIYFVGANAELLSSGVELSQVSVALNTWSNWHWLRTILAIVALGFASWGLLQESFNQHMETT
jgi:hypothetical protein